MKLTKKSPLSGREVTLDLPIIEDEYNAGQEKRRRGALIQDAFPTLPPEHREFILTGIGPEEWDEVFGGEDTIHNASNT